MSNMTASRKSCRRRRRSERGSITIEFAIIMSAVMVGFFVLMIGAGRVMKQENDVRSAAHAAARAASLRNDYATAQADITSIVDENLADSGVTCEAYSGVILSGPADFIPPNGFVTVEVSCTSRAIGGFPANVYSYQVTEVIDDYRSQP